MNGICMTSWPTDYQEEVPPKSRPNDKWPRRGGKESDPITWYHHMRITKRPQEWPVFEVIERKVNFVIDLSSNLYLLSILWDNVVGEDQVLLIVWQVQWLHHVPQWFYMNLKAHVVWSNYILIQYMIITWVSVRYIDPLNFSIPISR